MEEKVVNGLKYDDTIFFEEDGKKYKMVVHIRMNDECKNNICDFAATADIYELCRKVWRWFSGGCCHEAILKYAPQYKCFVGLHNRNHYGAHAYIIDNANYWYRQRKYEVLKEYLQLKDDELGEILLVADDKLALRWKLGEMGIVDRWHQEAKEAIAYLERLTGCKWVNPYSPKEERFVMKTLTEGEESLMTQRFNEGYYEEENVQIRREIAFKNKIEDQRAEEIVKFNKETKKWQEILNVKFSILDEGILLDNVIVYDHCKEVKFNWLSYKEQVSREDFDRYVSDMKSECRFEDWKFIFVEN